MPTALNKNLMQSKLNLNDTGKVGGFRSYILLEDRMAMMKKVVIKV